MRRKETYDLNGSAVLYAEGRLPGRGSFAGRRSFAGRWLTLGLLMLALMPLLQAQLISVKGRLDSDSMMIGDQLQLHLRVEAGPDLEFRMPLLEGALGEGMEVLEFLGADTVAGEDRRVVEQHYLLTGFEAGRQMIPSLEVGYIFREAEDTARSMPLFIMVHEPELDSAGLIRAIKPPINTPLSFQEVLPWAGGGLGLLALVALGVFLVLRYLVKKKDPEWGAPKIIEPAHVVAFRELDRLKEAKMWESGQVKAYYTRLTEISRQYIENQYGILAMESTTGEILDDFRKVNTEDDLLDEMLRDLLELADLVKFAKEDPLPVDNQTHLNNAYIFVQKTYPLFYQEKKQAQDE